MVNKVFADKIGQTMEIYMDDMLVKSSTIEKHMHDLADTFTIFKLYNKKLNLKKCTFKVKAWKLLGFIVSQRGIEANLKKI